MSTDQAPPTTESTSAADQPPIEERSVITQHTVDLGDGRTLAYKATAGTLVLTDEADKPTASIFHVAYELEGDHANADRPLVFAFNGGPGSSSVWLHLGILGPMRVQAADPDEPPAQVGVLGPNPDTLLEAADIVFIDPIGTGFSRPAPGKEAKDFYGLQQDVEALGEVIRIITTRMGRWASPKFLVGESYGTMRAAALAEHLQSRHGMYVDGLGLVSTVLHWGTLNFHRMNDLGFMVALPTMAATAAYHGVTSGDPVQRFAEAQEFALTDYATALLQGSRLTQGEVDRTAGRVAELIGLDASYVRAANLRVNQSRFCKELLRDRRRTVGRLDTRFTGIDLDSAGEHSGSGDPSYWAIQNPYTRAMGDYVRGSLGFETDLVYEILSGEPGKHWDYGQAGTNKYADVSDRLGHALNRDPNLRVLVASGYFDLATPMLGADMTVDHLWLDADRAGSVTTTRYEAGHMMYVNPTQSRRLGADLVQLVAPSGA
ncbi:MAG: carboxypeptidase C (cathepsin A) [Glaciecola sp.]|jgi:carboxypeptidase C (cathepsin A)